jgi:hypothetical protein
MDWMERGITNLQRGWGVGGRQGSREERGAGRSVSQANSNKAVVMQQGCVVLRLSRKAI